MSEEEERNEQLPFLFQDSHHPPIAKSTRHKRGDSFPVERLGEDEDIDTEDMMSTTVPSSRGESNDSLGTAVTGNTNTMKFPHITSSGDADDEDDNDDDDDEDDEEDDYSAMTSDRIRLGICAMDKKARSKPMAEILSRLGEDLFEVVFFGDEVILNEPVQDWPICDVLIAFFSKGYPLPKAKEYVALRRPLILNDLETQELMQDRRRVYDLLEASGIDVPRHVYLSRDGYVSTGTGDGNGSKDTEVKEFDDHIEVNGVSIHKPFVEKPVNAEGEFLMNIIILSRLLLTSC